MATSIETKSAYENLVQRAINDLNQRSIGDLSEMCRQAIAVDGERCEAYFLLSIAAYLLDDLGRALELAVRGHELSPDCNEGSDLLAHLYAHAGKPEESVYFAKLDAVGVSNPLLAGIRVSGLDDLAKALNETQEVSYRSEAMRAFYEERYGDAIQSFEKELRLRNGDGEFFRQFGNSLCKLGEVRRGIAALHGAIHIEPDNAKNFLHLGYAYLQAGDHDLARVCHEQALQLADGDIDIISGISFSLSPKMTIWPAFDEAVKAWRGEKEALGKADASSGKSSKEKAGRDTIRIGYILDRATECDLLRVIEPVLWHHDRNTMEVFVFSTDLPDDPTAKRLRSLAKFWVDIRDASDTMVANTIKGQDLDILIDMTLTAKGQRHEILVTKPAPRIYRWLGEMQGAFSFLYDGPLPANISSRKPRLTETVVLDGKTMPAVDGHSPVQTRKAITFGATADLARVTPDVAMVWASILRQVPGSLLILGNIHNISTAVESRFLEIFAIAGVVDRIQFEELDNNVDDGLIVSRLKFLVGMDIYLDAFPISGLIELADALWCGVPVISMVADQSSSVSAAIMTAAGYPEWIAHDTDAYIDLAVSTASAVTDTPDWRPAMHSKVKESVVFQPDAWKKVHCKLLHDLVDKT